MAWGGSNVVRFGGLALGALVAAGAVGTYLMVADTSISSTGPTPVSDYREFPARDASLTLVADGLDAPWAFDWLPNGDIVVTERFGAVRLIRDGALAPEPVAGAPAVFAAEQGGLLDVAVHPDFAAKPYLYLSFAHGDARANRLRAIRATFDGAALSAPETIFEVEAAKSGGQHYGSRFHWTPDGLLLISVGDGGNPPTAFDGALIREQAQNLQTHFGKMIRLEDDGGVPDDNPFVGRDDALPEIFSYGHRNVQGIAVDPASGAILASEHGGKGGDELNLVEAGANYGWPRATYSTEYDLTGTMIAGAQSLPDMRDPLAVWTPAIAPSELVLYTGERHPEWRGDLFLAAMLLRADNSLSAYLRAPAGAVLRIERDDEGAVIAQERLLVGEVRVRSIEQGPDGHLYVLTDGVAPQSEPGAAAGALWRLDG